MIKQLSPTFTTTVTIFFATDQTGAIVGGVFGGAVGGALLTIISVTVGIRVYQRRKKVSCLKSILFKQHAAK